MGLRGDAMSNHSDLYIAYGVKYNLVKYWAVFCKIRRPKIDTPWRHDPCSKRGLCRWQLGYCSSRTLLVLQEQWRKADKDSMKVLYSEPQKVGTSI